MSKVKYDICGWATKNDIRCRDGRTIRRDAFKECHGARVPIVYQHNHQDIGNVLGHAILENRPEGVYYYGSFNNSANGQAAKEAVYHGDLCAVSIYANDLQQSKTGDVYHGMIRELSLALAPANPGATLEFPVMQHSGLEADDRAVLTPARGEQELVLQHGEIDYDETTGMIGVAGGTAAAADPNAMAQSAVPPAAPAEPAPAAAPELPATNPEAPAGEAGDLSHSDLGGKSVAEIYENMTDEQKAAMAILFGSAMESSKSVQHSEIQNGGNTEMNLQHNAFDVSGVVLGANTEGTTLDELSHSQIAAIFDDAKRGSGTTLSEAVLAHADDYGIRDIEWLFPEARNVNNPPDWLKRPDGWVSKVMGGVHHSPFSRIKTMQADITADEARAKGYIKGNLKKEEVFSLLRRTTTPTTIYKKQKFDRDDIIDITDFDVVAWVKAEMRMMLDEEIARSILIGDGRPADSEDKINETNVRPIWKDTAGDLYAVRCLVDVSDSDDETARGKKFIRACIRNRKNYRGSGNPTLFTTEDFLTDMLLIEDGIGHLLYESESKLATTLRVKEIVTVPVMEGATRTVGEGSNEETFALMGIIVNLNDYNVGADKGGAVAMFDDFDIDYNQYKYLIETRISGCLTRIKSALVFEYKTANAPAAPSGEVDDDIG